MDQVLDWVRGGKVWGYSQIKKTLLMPHKECRIWTKAGDDDFSIKSTYETLTRTPFIPNLIGVRSESFKSTNGMVYSCGESIESVFR